MERCAICEKRIWFWQKKVCVIAHGSNKAHWNCAIKLAAHRFNAFLLGYPWK